MVYNWDSAATRDLIYKVKVNPGLYAKSAKVYKNQNEKNLAWTELGKTFHPRCLGEEAARKFKSLRDVFCKERRKIISTQPKSGAGAAGYTQYKPTWDYYSDLLFLVDHIEPRKTYSNMTSSESCTVQNLFECDENTMSNLTQNLNTSTVNTNDEMISNISTPINVDMVNGALQSINTNIIYDSDIMINNDSIVESSEKNFNEKILTNTGHDTSLSSIRQKITSKRENKVPPNDTMHKKKKNESMDLITSNINTFANIANNCMSELCQDKEKEASTDIFKVALQFIPEESKLLFMIDVLRISDIYRKGKRPFISEID